MAETNAEDNELHYPFTRCSSTGSLHAITSSANTSDDEDSDLGGTQISVKDRRREAHTQAEQKRRDAIKKGYDSLQDLVPMCQNSDNSQSYKLSKATVLQKSVDYIHYMQNCKKKQEDEVAALKKEVIAMTIMKLNYEQIVSAHQSQPGNLSRQVPDDVKFEVFRALIDSLFQTFDLSVTTNNFAEVSGSVIQWVEEHCKPQILREVMSGILCQLQQHEIAASPPHQTPGMVISPQGQLLTPLGLLAQSANAVSLVNSSSVCTSSPILDGASACNLSTVLYTSPGAGVGNTRAMPSGSFLN